MNATIDILRGELERLFSLEEMTTISSRLLGLDPQDVGGATAKATFARALTERCVDGDRLEALVDVIVASKPAVDPRVRDLALLHGKDEIAQGKKCGPFLVLRKIGESELSFVYLAKGAAPDEASQAGAGAPDVVLKLLRRAACRDRSAVQRFLTANRLVATVDHEGLPRDVTAGELEPGLFYVSYAHVEAQTLAARLARTGPSHINELKPILRGILEPLAALHKAHLVHGDIKLENILVGRAPGSGADASGLRVTLIDFGTDRLRHRPAASNGHTGILAVFGSPKTIAPEQVRGRACEPATDVYAFGAVMYELLSGKPVFVSDSATDAAIAHLTKAPEPPSAKAPRGWVSKQVDAFVMSLLAKNPAERPKDAAALLDALDALGRGVSTRPPGAPFPEEKLTQLIDLLIAAPDDHESALGLEQAVDEGADPMKIAEAFDLAADGMDISDDDAKETKKSLLYRAARIFDNACKDKARAEKVFQEICELDSDDVIAQIALEEIRKALGKYEELVEMLIARSEAASPGEDRARVFAEIGRLCANELEDPEQALVAFTRAVCETPADEEYAAEVERLAGDNTRYWNEALSTVTEGIKHEALSTTDKNALLAHAGRWYDVKLGRADTALLAYQQILTTDPASEAANEGLSVIYRRAQQWPELASVLLARAGAAPSSPRARDLRVEAAEILETKLNDADRAKELYGAVLAEDPGHTRASEAMARVAERTGDYTTLVTILERRAEARRGSERADALAKIAEVFEDHLNDLAEATRRYEAALAIEPAHLASLKGLDRIFNRSEKYRELLENLERQVALAATPRQKINLYERMAGLHDEQFLDHAKAAECQAAILAIDPANDQALTTLPRHYRALGKWEELVKLYEKHAAITGEEARRIELLMLKARVLAEQIGSPERATRAFEQVLELAPGHAGALEALARLRELTGDAHAALSAIEALAQKAASPEARAEQWMRAGRLLDSRGDKDGAIERYKLALDANPKDTLASAALRQSYGQRGDALSVVTLIEKELRHAEGNLAKARLYAELASLYKGRLRDNDEAEANAKRAIDYDGTNAEALMVLGDVAFEGQRYVEATAKYETLIGRASALPKEDSVRVLLRFMEAFGKSTATARPSSPAVGDASNPRLSTPALPSGDRLSAPPSVPASVPPGSSPAPAASSSRMPVSQRPRTMHPRLANAVEVLQHLAPDDPEALARVARVLFDHGDPNAARETYEDLLEKHAKTLSSADRSDALYRLGESMRRAGDLDGALKPLKEAADADPANVLPLQAIAKIHEEKGDWEAVVHTKRRRLDVATGAERFDLLLDIGDIEFQKLGDRTRASKTWVTALEERPDDRKLLTKLMQLYSEEKDWAKLVEVVLRLADFVEDPKQRAKYMHTAAIVASRQLGEAKDALRYYERALEFDPTLTKAADEALELCREKGDHDGVERLLKGQLERAKETQDRAKITVVLDQLGELYQKFLGEPELAVDAYEAAHAFDPEDRPRLEKLAELYASDAEQYLDKAVKMQAQILRRNPYRMESYKQLRKLYTEARKADAAWCLCQALSVLKVAEPDEERFYKRHRPDNAAAAQAVLDDADWDARLAHHDLDPVVTKIFAAIQPTILRAGAQSVEELGYDMRYAIDVSRHPYPISQTLYYVQGVLGVPPPLVFQNQDDPSGLGFLHAQTPAVVLGRVAFEAQVSNQSLAFVAGRHLAYFRPGYYVRQLLPTGTALKAWLFAAIKVCVPQFPVAADLQTQVTEAMDAVNADFTGAKRDHLQSLVSKLLESGGAIDLKRWVAAVDLTADRAGFLLAHDLEVASEVMRATEEAASVPSKERTKEAVLFAVSEEYLSLREKLAIGVE